ncbi:MAG: hypothetical protein HY898_34920 [Deltaproteobacteria bacterium]|nr:hypothetical protein [Deltaproteobacteria bacterium]
MKRPPSTRRGLRAAAASVLALVMVAAAALAAPPKAPAAKAAPRDSASSKPAARDAAAPKPAPRDATSQKIEREARADFQSANYGQAERKLKQAVDRCGTKSCSAEVKAQLLVTLGLVYAGGFRKGAEASSAFVEALKLDPKATIPAGLGSPEAQRLFEEARATALPPPPPSSASAPPAASSAPEAVEVPIKPLETLGDAKWSDGLGIVRGADPAQSSSKPPETVGAPISLRQPKALDLDEAFLRLSLGKRTYTPINDGQAGSGTDLSGFFFALDGRPEWRSVTSPIGIWFDLGLSLMPYVSGPLKVPASRSTEPMQVKLTHFEFHGQFGIDATPWTFISVGPFVGYHGDLYGVTLKDEQSLNASSSSSSGGKGNASFDHGLDYGGHIRLRTLERVGKPAVLYGDYAMSHRRGRYLTATVQHVEVGVRPGSSVQLFLFYESRSSASGYVSLADVHDPADVLGTMMPVETVMGLGIGGSLLVGPVEAANPSGPADGRRGGK